jgi:hypothetical protein
MLYYLCVYSGKRPDESDFPGQRHTTGFLGFTQPPILVGGGGDGRRDGSHAYSTVKRLLPNSSVQDTAPQIQAERLDKKDDI